CASDQVGLADASRADKNDVLLRVLRCFLAFERKPDVVVMIAQRHTQNLLGLILTNDEPIQILLYVAGFVVELERAASFLGLSRNVGRRRLLSLRAGLLKMLTDEIGKLPLEFLRRH